MVTTEKPRAQFSPVADYRSDVVTIPDEGMFAAMKEAHLGDDVYLESETTQELEHHIATMCGKEAGLFCASGTQGNQICLRTHLHQPPYSILCDARGHIINYEAGGIAMFSQAMSTPVTPANGKYITATEVEKALILGEDVHYADTKLISLENTLNGVIFPIEEIAKISALARSHGIPIHVDGARLFEASAATGISLSQYGELFDTMSLCLSKGIGAPIGTVIVGSASFIKTARRFRKMMGGGMRQVGILAGAARYALDAQFPEGLKRVHERVSRTAEYARSKGLVLAHPADTNMCWFDLEASGIDADKWIEKGKEYGVTLSGGRCVFHHQITDDGEKRLWKVIHAFAK